MIGRWGLWLGLFAALLVLGCESPENAARRELPYEIMDPDSADASGRRFQEGVVPERDLVFRDAKLPEVLARLRAHFRCAFDAGADAALYADRHKVRFDVRSGDLTDDLLFEWARTLLEMKGFKLIPVEHGFRVVLRTQRDFVSAKR